jgi:hypothetical protein
MRKSWRIQRRTFLRGIGATLALPTLDIMASEGSTEAAPPARFVTIFQPNGFHPSGWDVKGVGKEFTLSRILRPLQRFRNDMVVLSNIDNPGSGHIPNTAAFMTAVPPTRVNGTNTYQSGISLDYLLAQQLGKETLIPNLNLALEPSGQGFDAGFPRSLGSTISWSSDTTPVIPEVSPQVAFDNLFRRHVGPEAKQRAKKHQSVLDYVRDEIAGLEKKASVMDRQRLEQYYDSVREVEVKLDKALNPPEKSWHPKSKPDLLRPPAGIPDDYAEHMRLMFELLALALWTDTTRVGSLMFGISQTTQSLNFIKGMNGTHHGVSHHRNIPQNLERYNALNTWYATELAKFIAKLKSVNEGNGTLLDNSIVMFGSCMKDGNLHVPKDLPLVLLGKGGGRLKTGRHLRCKKGTPLGSLHLTLLQKYGVESEKFGNSKGVISELS